MSEQSGSEPVENPDPQSQEFSLATDGGDRKRGAQAFLRLYVENQRRLQAYIRTLLPNRTDADDVLQEVTYVLFEKFDPERPPRDFAAWGCRIAYYKVLALIKKKSRSRVCFSQELLEQLAETVTEQAETLQLEERLVALRDCLRKLNEKDRELLTLRLEDGASTESTASRVGRSADAVYKALTRIRRALFDCVSHAVARQES